MRRVVKSNDTVTVDEVGCGDFIVAYKQCSLVYHLVGVVDNDVVYSFHPMHCQGGPEFTTEELDKSLSLAVAAGREVYAFEDEWDFLKWALDKK